MAANEQGFAAGVELEFRLPEPFADNFVYLKLSTIAQSCCVRTEPKLNKDKMLKFDLSSHICAKPFVSGSLFYVAVTLYKHTRDSHLGT